MSLIWDLLRLIGNVAWLGVLIWAGGRYVRGWRLEWRPPCRKDRADAIEGQP